MPNHASTSVGSVLAAALALSPAHCPLCAFQSAFWQAAPQYAATVHTEHFFSGTPAAPQHQQTFSFSLSIEAGGGVQVASDDGGMTEGGGAEGAEGDEEDGMEGLEAVRLLSPSLVDPDTGGKIDPGMVDLLDPDPVYPLGTKDFKMSSNSVVIAFISDPFDEAPCSLTKMGRAPAVSIATRSASVPSSTTRVSNDTTISRVCAEPE